MNIDNLTADAVIDLDELGRRVRAARTLAGMDTVRDVGEKMRRGGVKISERTLYAIERGEQEPTTTTMLALVLCLDPPGGYAFFAPALREDFRPVWERFTTPADPDLIVEVRRAIEDAIGAAFREEQVRVGG